MVSAAQEKNSEIIQGRASDPEFLWIFRGKNSVSPGRDEAQTKRIQGFGSAPELLLNSFRNHGSDRRHHLNHRG